MTQVDRIATRLQEDGRYRCEFVSLAELVHAAALVGMDADEVKLYGDISYRPRSKRRT